jgi:membrane associated rhomboid family serine protease
VRERDAANALDTIQQYEEENKEAVPSHKPPSLPLQKNRSGLWVALGLLLCHGAIYTMGTVEHTVRMYGSSASRIVDGEVYRTVTSLMLHSGPLHLVGNMVGVALFGTALCSLTGVGIGWLMILAAGAFGNLFNAFFYSTAHLSIGGSTAVFGALGILCVQQFLRRKMRDGTTEKMKAWIPFAGGLALLGLLGTGERADLMAHLFGFLAGIGLGGLSANLATKPLTQQQQKLSLVAAVAIVVVAWLGPAVR